MLGNLKGRVAFVTGASRGIGRSICLVMAEQGADIVLADIATKGALEVAKEVEKLKRKALVVQVDVAKRDSVAAAVRKALDTLGHIDILVNNASVVYAPGRITSEDGTDTDEDWHYVLSVNLLGPVYCCEAILPQMKERRYGKIINIGSVAAHASRPPHASGLGIPNAYPVSKAALLRYTKALVHQVSEFNINVNAICPSMVWTPTTREQIEEMIRNRPELANRAPHDVYLEARWAEVPLHREQAPEDIAKMAAFLASEDARNVTGQCIHVDGGMILRD
jgi:NAD(P)-dependent dehydrogenase (short-subunit alcohol dehydrogenase family)